ncbi:MAG: hypothetical protein NT120_03510 [Candidatus Aenigmarchaeota archaeon]|nr:hypothetical protein [Candidatus Aenigmarchaeota archaeon]
MPDLYFSKAIINESALSSRTYVSRLARERVRADASYIGDDRTVVVSPTKPFKGGIKNQIRRIKRVMRSLGYEYGHD